MPTTPRRTSPAIVAPEERLVAFLAVRSGSAACIRPQEPGRHRSRIP
ncbi:MAG: hypothetical protein KDD85_02500 [Parvularculaceae bacterium]|nr:hypothetical protein [Parvularculaceae bacterium]